MTSPVSQPIPSGLRAFFRCWLIAVIVFAYLAGSVASMYLRDGIAGRIARAIFGLPYNSSLIRYAAGLCLLAVLVWAHRRVRRAWKDPRARLLRFFSYLPLLFLALVTWVVLFATAPLDVIFGETVPLDVQWAILNPDHVVLYSIGASQEIQRDASGKLVFVEQDSSDTFHRYTIRGSVTLDGKQASEAAGAFRYALNFPCFFPSLCFNPRHGLRINSGNHVYDFLLCYECGVISVYRDGKPIIHRSATGSSATLDALLIDAKILPAKPPGE